MTLLIRTIKRNLKDNSLLQKVYLSEYLDWVFKLRGTYRSYKEMFRRMLFWGWHMRWSWDFDAQTLYKMLQLKLSRLNYVFENHGHCVWNSDRDNKRMRELREMIELFKRLFEDEYQIKAYEESLKDCLKRYDSYKKWESLRKQHKERAFYLLKKNIDILWD